MRLWEAAASVETVRLAWLPIRLAVPSGVLPSKNVTEPLGLPDPGLTTPTVALSVTGCPYTDGPMSIVSVVVVLAWLTISFTTAEVLPLKLLELSSPRYWAVRLWEAAASVETVRLAWLPIRLAVPSGVLPSKNSTEPLGLPDPGLTTPTVALSVTGCPYTDGLLSTASVVVVAAWLTVWDRGDEVLVMKLLFPP